MQESKYPWQNLLILPGTNLQSAVPPCFMEHPYTLQVPSYLRQLTYALTSQNTRHFTEITAFDCALCGPFDELFSACSQPPGSL